MGATSPPALPAEIHGAIIESIDHIPTLLSLLVTSRMLHVEAERSLYHTISLERRHQPTRAILFLQRVGTCERVARLVVRLSFGRSVPTPDTASQLKAHIVASLPKLVNLKALICRISFLDVPLSLSECPFQLIEFEWMAGVFDDLDLRAFLAGQPRLERFLSYYWGESPILPLPESTGQKLVALGMNSSHVAAFLPGRQIKYLQWAAPKVDEATLASISEPLSKLCSLVLRATGDDSAIRTLVPHLTGLQYLAVEATDMILPNLYIPLTSLRGLTLLAPNLVFRDRPREVARALLRAMPNLRFVEISAPLQPVWRWTAGARDIGVVVSQHDWMSPIM